MTNMYTKREVTSGLFWSSMNMASHFGVSLLVKLVLAYYLLPEHFGLIGMAATATALTAVFADMGIGAALIQKKGENLQPIHWTSAFWFNLMINLISFCFMLIVVSPLAAHYFGELRLHILIVGLSISLLIQPFYFIHRIRLQKEMKFKQTFVPNITGSICGGLAGITMAVKGFGVWSFVGQGLASALVQVPIYWLMVRWYPRFQFSLTRTKDLMSFGIYDTGIRLLGFGYNHLNIIILGAIFSPVVVGYFAFARGLTLALLNPINGLIKKVLFPFFSGIQDELSRIKSYHLTQIRYVTGIIFPFSVGISLLAHDVLNSVWGDKWLGAVFPVQILSAFIAVMAMGGTPAIILKSVGKMKESLILQIIRFVLIKTPIVIIGGVFFGFPGFLYALLLSQLIIFFIDFCFIRKIINLRFINICSQIFVPSISSAIMAICLYSLKSSISSDSIETLLFYGVFGIVSYSILFLGLNRLSYKFLGAQVIFWKGLYL